jgi:hypothetical protein
MALIEMVYSACAEWLNDFITTYQQPLVDAYDAANYYDEIMKEAVKIFLEYGFQTQRARNDAILILRSLFYEHYLWQKLISQHNINADGTVQKRLEQTPQTAQKSAAWHSESYDVLSGHEFGAICVGSKAEKQAIYIKKCNKQVLYAQNETEESQTVFVTPEDGQLSPFKWGWRYEPVARSVFEKHYADGTVIDTLGRIRHSILPRLGASPDGLIITGPRCGRLVELKCPFSRILDGKIPIRYYAQMQLQAEVCDVQAVEYFECCFKEVPLLCEEHIQHSNLPYVGKLCVICTNEQKEYIYSPLFPASHTGIKDANGWLPKDNPEILESVCWYIKDSFTDTIVRNPRWWNTIGKPAYEEFWHTVDNARLNNDYKIEYIPLFIDDELDMAEEVASDHESHGSEYEQDEIANDEDEIYNESDAETL